MTGLDVRAKGLLIGGGVVLLMAILSIKALLLTALVLVVPFAIWWAVDRARTSRQAASPQRWPGPAASPGQWAGPAPSPPLSAARFPRPGGPATFVGPTGTSMRPVPARDAPPAPPPRTLLGAAPWGPSGHEAPSVAPRAARPVAATGPALLAAEVQVTVTREQDHQDVLARRHCPGPDGKTAMVVDLSSSTVSGGKYAGQYGVEVRIQGARVGELTAAMSRRYAHLVQEAERGGLPARAKGVLSQGSKGLQVDLRMPRQ